MKRVLVIGASGSMGHAIVRELINREMFEVVAFARTHSKLQRLFGSDPHVSIVSGDVFHVEEIRTVARDVDIIFHAMNIPYPEWEEKLPTLLSNILLVAMEANAKLVAVDNIYSYGIDNREKITEKR